MSAAASPGAAPTTRTGACQCGRVRWRAQAPSAVELCHCGMCRRAVGNIFMASLGVPRSTVTWQGAPATYASSPIATRGFCAHCGTPLFFAYNDSDHLDLMAGTDDDPATLRPDRHFGVESRLDAFRGLDGLPEAETADAPEVVRRWTEATGHAPD